MSDVAPVAGARRRPPPLVHMWDVLEEHLDEADFLFAQWRLAMVSPRHKAREVGEGPERRLLAHLDALTAAGRPVIDRLLLPSLGTDDEGRFEAAALSLGELGADGASQVIAALARTAPGRWKTGAKALGLSRAPVDRALVDALRHDAAELQAAALTALALREGAAEAAGFLASPEPHVRAAALRATARAGVATRAAVERGLQAADPPERDAAIWAGLTLGLRSAWETARRVVERSLPEPATALEVLAMSGEPEDLDRLEGAVAAAPTRAVALRALGRSGWPRAAELCLAHAVGDARSARLAGEAFSAISGLRIEGLFAAPDEAQEPEDDAAPVADHLPVPEGELPCPDAAELGAWWRQEHGRFDPGVRYLGGKPLTAETLLERFVAAPMRQRHALGRELGVRSHGAWAPETRTWARTQLRFQAETKLVVRADFTQPFRRLLRA